MGKITEEAVLFTNGQLHKLGNELCNVLKVIELQNRLLKHIAPTRNIKSEDFTIYYDNLYKSTDAMYEVNQGLIEKLDEVAYALLSSTDYAELKTCNLINVAIVEGELP